MLQGLGPLSARDFKPCASEERLRTSWPCVRAEEQPTARIAAQGMAAPGAAMKAETSQFRAAVWKKRKRDEKGSGSGEDDEGGSEMIVHVPRAVEKRIKACVLMDPELGNITVTKALAVEGLQRGLEEAHARQQPPHLGLPAPQGRRHAPVCTYRCVLRGILKTGCPSAAISLLP